MFRESATIEIPATSANLGPGYDCLGLALSLSNRVTLKHLPGTVSIEPAHPMVAQVAALFFQQREVSVAPFAFSWTIEGEVPQSRGLGSSVTVRLGIMMALNEMCGQPLNRERLFEVCSESEGHPDNVGPAVFGGFVLSRNNTQWFRFPVQPRLKVVVVIPDYEVQTTHARAALPVSVPHGDAARNTANACSLVAAFATGAYERMAGALDDFLHQPYRQHLVPDLFEIIDAGIRAGAIGGYLSGSGSTIACLTTSDEPEAVRQAMLAALHKTGAGGIGHILAANNDGAKILE